MRRRSREPAVAATFLQNLIEIGDMPPEISARGRVVNLGPERRRDRLPIEQRSIAQREIREKRPHFRMAPEDYRPIAYDRASPAEKENAERPVRVVERSRARNAFTVQHLYHGPSDPATKDAGTYAAGHTHLY